MLDSITDHQGFQKALLRAKTAQHASATLITMLSARLQQQGSASVVRLGALWRSASHAQAHIKARVLGSIVATLITCGAFPLWNGSLATVNVRAMNDLGLVSVLPVGCFVALGALSLGFCFALVGVHGRWRPWLLTLYLLSLIFMLYATPTLVEQAPRFQVTYWLAGHTEYILRTGAVDRYLDAYFNWPGFFALTGLLTKATGLQSVMAFAPWASLAYNLLYLPPMYLIYTSATRDYRIVWLGLWFFSITDWVWQDYFSPQGLNLFFYLVIIAMLLKWFKSAQAQPPALVRTMAMWVLSLPSRLTTLWADRSALGALGASVASAWWSAWWSAWKRWRNGVVITFKNAYAHPGATRDTLVTWLRVMWARMRRGAASVIMACGHPRQVYQRHEQQIQPWLAISDTPLAPAERRKRIGLLVALIAIFALSLVSHPVTPFFVLLSVGALVLSGQCAPRWLPILMGAMILGWDLTVASPYMAGHLAIDLSTFGSLGQATSANLTNRLAGGSAQHHFVAEVRVALTGLVWGLAILGAALRWRRAANWYAGNGAWGAGSLFRHDLSYLLLATVPLLMIIAQPYGGEMAMRSYLLSLPLVTFFAASAFYMPASDMVARLGHALSVEVSKIATPRNSLIVSTAATSTACLLLLACFLFARYGNERADVITYNEVNAVSYLYSIAPPHSQLLAGWSGTPWRYQDLELYDYSSLYPQANGADLLRAHDIQGILRASSNTRFAGTYVIITRSQMMQAEMFDGVAPSALTTVEQQLLASGRFARVYSNPDAVILMYLRPAPVPLGAFPNHPYKVTPIAREFAR